MTDATANNLRRVAFGVYLLSWVLPVTSGNDGWMSFGVGVFVLSVFHGMFSVAGVFTMLSNPSWETFATMCSGFYFGFLAFGNAWVFERMLTKRVISEKLALAYTLAAWGVPVAFLLLPDMKPTMLIVGYYCWAVGLTFVLIDPRRRSLPDGGV